MKPYKLISEEGGWRIVGPEFDLALSNEHESRVILDLLNKAYNQGYWKGIRDKS